MGGMVICVLICILGFFIWDVSNICIFVKDLNFVFIKLYLYNGKDKGLFIDF